MLNSFFFFLLSTFKFLLIIVPILVCVAFFTLLERKFIGYIQRRKGPNVTGILGSTQAFADGLKLLSKEVLVPGNVNKYFYTLSPILVLFLSLMGWAVMPFGYGAVYSNLNIGILYLFAISSFSVYGIIMAGWSSNSKYAFFGALRSAAQMISYEVSLGITILIIIVHAGSLNLTEIVYAQYFAGFPYGFIVYPSFILFIIAMIAETNRAPFDLPEAEAELVSGYNVEYASVGFAFFFIGEYANIILFSGVCSVLYLGGWVSPFPDTDILFLEMIPVYCWVSLKIIFTILLVILVRAALPRYRYDQLMFLGWKIFMPLGLGFLLFYASVMWAFDLLYL